MNEDKQSCRARHGIRILSKSPFISAITGLFLLMPMVASAADRDIELAKSLIAAMKQSNAPERDRIEEIFDQIPKESPCRPVAAQATTLVYIQQGQFSKAWRCLQSTPAKGTSLELNEQRLKLWLLLEAESTKDTDILFKNVVRMAFSESLENGEKFSLIDHLGVLIGMLQANQQPGVIPRETIQQAKSALESRLSKSNASRFLEHWGKSNQRGLALVDRIAEFHSLGEEGAKNAVLALESELEEVKKETETIKEKMEREGRAVDEIETQRRHFFEVKKNLKIEWGKETEGKPRLPVPPVRPREPKTTYKEDNNGRRVVDKSPSPYEMREYDKRMQEFRSEERQFETDRQTYPARLAAWNQKDGQRRAMLQTQMQQVNGSISVKDKEIDAAKSQIREGVASELKESIAAQHALDERVLVSQLALAEVSDPNPKSKSSLRPSRFSLIDYSLEESRLLRALR